MTRGGGDAGGAQSGAILEVVVSFFSGDSKLARILLKEMSATCHGQMETTCGEYTLSKKKS